MKRQDGEEQLLSHLVDQVGAMVACPRVEAVGKKRDGQVRGVVWR